VPDGGNAGKTNATNASTSISGNGKGAASASTSGSILGATRAGASALTFTERWIAMTEDEREG
jgi:hypothetical protein